ncbi:hypothetical protein CO610_04835 [Lysobacteraceae bacterium NML95-0200]|nr:hypothetical protein CO610_04835 [Xanthomonadaceae bacterium NML95-0200]
MLVQHAMTEENAMSWGALPPGPMLRCHLRVQPLRPLANIDYPGSMLRGAFGHALRRLACRCGTERHADDCVYARIFEPEGLGGHCGKNRVSPPFVITPPFTRASEREGFDFSMTLMGAAREHFHWVAEAWELAGQTGLGAGKVKCLVLFEGMEQNPERVLPARWLELHTTSPLFLKKQGHCMPPESLELSDVLAALQRRLEITSRLYLTPPTLPDWDAWHQACARLEMETLLRVARYQRYSNRQKQYVPVEGLQGAIRISGLIPDTLLNAFALGQWLHIGGKTSLGMGAYRVHTPHHLRSALTPCVFP